MIDVHCHYLPAVDDGAPDLQIALWLIRLARADGVRQLVLTPRIPAGGRCHSLSFLRPRFDAFRRLVMTKVADIELYLGAEVLLQPESMRLLANGQLPFVGGWDGMRVLLMALPPDRIPPYMLDAVHYLMEQGVLPMLAQPERNRVVIRRPAVLDPFMEAGCLLQLNAAALTGHYGPPAYRTAHAILRRNRECIVASGAYDARLHPSRMAEAFRTLEAHYGQRMAEDVFILRPERLLVERMMLGLDAAAHLSGPAADADGRPGSRGLVVRGYR